MQVMGSKSIRRLCIILKGKGIYIYIRCRCDAHGEDEIGATEASFAHGVRVKGAREDRSRESIRPWAGEMDLLNTTNYG